MECAAVEQPSRLRGGGRAFFSDSVWERTMVVSVSVVAWKECRKGCVSV